MPRRWWGLSTRQTVVLFAAALLVGVAVAFALGPGGGDSGADDIRRAGRVPAVERVPIGTPASAAAVWVFGFETLRFDPMLTRGGQLALQGFGDVLGTTGAVALFDSGTGRIGLLDARRDELRTVATLTPGANPDRAFLPTVAAAGSTLWVSPDPGVVVPVDPTTGGVGVPVHVGSADASSTGVVASGTEVFTATSTADEVEIARIGEADEVSVTTALAGASLDGFAVDATTVWLRSGAHLYSLDRETLAVEQRVAVPTRGGVDAIGGLVTADDSVWMLADGGSTLLRYAPARKRFARVVRLLDRGPERVELPAALVTDGRRVVAMVQRSGEGELAVRVTVHDPVRDRTRAVDVPGRIAAGALAVTSR